MSKNLKSFILLGLVVLILGIIAACDSAENDKEEESQTKDVGATIEYTITGIEPGAGITGSAGDALEEYSNLEGYTLNESSTAAMLTSLDEAIDKEEPIVVTGWTPHWKFAKYELKFLEDPKGSFGEAENINTIARLELEKDMPEAYTVLDRFFWEVEDMEAVMLMTQEEDMSFEEAASQWIKDNEDKVAEWTKGVEKVDGEEIELVSTPWDTERASTSVVKNVLTSLGYEVTDTPVDPAVMFQAVATNDADASVAPWLPKTHGSFYEEYKDEVIDLGPNLEGAKLGLVVPAYMEIDSIEDLKPKE
ncbi:glycine betaine ABC transporter substrate-binding protein [Paraliobacillus sp. JSM ZJ581]|uniref:glycine betaine ABC transporter substrate-binding protein n=1 Tax=Paraliobacillus sp. JSM ZJ581 TaxID=3342118 RepID=UPI0035A851A6